MEARLSERRWPRVEREASVLNCTINHTASVYHILTFVFVFSVHYFILCENKSLYCLKKHNSKDNNQTLWIVIHTH